MAKRKVIKTASKFIPPQVTTDVIPEDLMQQLGAIQAVATAFNVLDKGYFPHSYSEAVKKSLAFLAKLHEQTVEGALKHPQAHMASELKQYVAAPLEPDTTQTTKDTTDGTTEAQPTQ